MSAVVQADCRIGMVSMPDNSVDLILTDPPYGLSFMQDDWDIYPSLKRKSSQSMVSPLQQ